MRKLRTEEVLRLIPIDPEATDYRMFSSSAEAWLASNKVSWTILWAERNLLTKQSISDRESIIGNTEAQLVQIRW